MAQFILSDEEIETIHDALLDKRSTIEQNMKGRGQTMRTVHMEADISELTEIIKRLEPYLNEA